MCIEELSCRALSEGDANAVLALLHELEHDLGVRRRTPVEELRDRWRLTDLERNSWAFEEKGRLVAVGWVSPHGDVAGADGVVAPEARGRGLGTRLCELAETRAHELGLAVVSEHAYEADARARALFQSRGYREARRFYEMAVDLEEPPAPSVWPDGIAPRTFRAEDARRYYDAMLESFAGESGFVALPFGEWRRVRVLGSDTSLYFAAWDGDEIAGVARCEARSPGGGFVGLLGVRPAWRQRGLGRALLLHALGAFWERGERHVSLGVDAENPSGATRLYESVGMTVRAAAVAYEKQLG